jgi:long-chain acyl-CoA synthetase
MFLPYCYCLPMQTLLELLPRFAQLGNREAIRWHNGFRTQVVSYAELDDLIRAAAALLEQKNIRKGDRIVLWGENRPEWVAVFWACVASGVQVVPLDFRFSLDLVNRIYAEAKPKLLFHGSSVDSQHLVEIDRISLDSIAHLRGAPRSHAVTAPADVTPEDIVEIVYTSGTTGEPKGVVHRHRNICANLRPFETEIEKYKKWAAPFQPIRTLDLLPLSHMFGQAQGLFIPVFLEGAVMFTDEIHPGKIIQLVHDQRISVITSVPRILENLRNEIQRRFDLPEPPSTKGWIGVVRRWWRYRRVHRRFGLKFWAFVVGGAAVDPALEDFWSKLGFVVVQGYGLTEASPVVAVNHPFEARRGSLGKVVPGQDVMIADDGEILVRGPSVTLETGEWLHTGDLGEIDQEGRLYFRGRKKDLIVTAEGLNVHPEDVENVLNAFPEIRESAVVAAGQDANEVVHAALILKDPSADPEALIRRANERLESHQRIRSWSIWPEDDFPRTASTLKIRRNEVAARIRKGGPAPAAAAQMDLSAMSSLERVELLSDLEDRYQVELDEEAFSRITTNEQLDEWLKQPQRAREARAERELPVAEWARSRPVRWFRAAFQQFIARPLFRHYITLTVVGLENLEAVEPPVIFAANHTSNLDTVAVFAALPRRWRNRLAPAARKEAFQAHFEPDRFPRKEVWRWHLGYVAACSIFNTYPLPQVMAGARRALKYTGELISRGYCPLVFPEGKLTSDGRMDAFRPGIGMMAVQLRVPVVPIHIQGLFELYSRHDSWPKRGSARVSIGQPLEFPAGTSYEVAAQQVQEAVEKLVCRGAATQS